MVIEQSIDLEKELKNYKAEFRYNEGAKRHEVRIVSKEDFTIGMLFKRESSWEIVGQDKEYYDLVEGVKKAVKDYLVVTGEIEDVNKALKGEG